MKIALTSMDILWEDKSVNRKKCTELIKRASDCGARLILFPETTLTGFTMNVATCGEMPDEGGLTETVRFFSDKSREYKMAVGFGYIRRDGKKGSNRFVIVDNGRIIGDYGKLHPFSYGEENLFYEPGNEMVSVKIDDVALGLFICYDLRFPEIFQKSSEENTVLAVIANWPKERVDHWKCLLRARAIETQCVVLGVNRNGSGGGLVYEDSSEAYDCVGNRMEEECSCTVSGDSLTVYDVNPEMVLQKRKEFPVKKDRRKDLYLKFYEE